MEFTFEGTNMPRPASELLTDREAQIMEILWSRGRATAEEVRTALTDEPHDSTVRTLLRVLKEKGYVKIAGRQPAVFVPTVGEPSIWRWSAADWLLKATVVLVAALLLDAVLRRWAVACVTMWNGALIALVALAVAEAALPKSDVLRRFWPAATVGGDAVS